MPSQTYAEWLRQKAKAAGYDVDSAKGGRSQLAAAAGMSVTQVGRTLAGDTVPSVESQRGLCHALKAKGVNVSLDEMLVRSGTAEWSDFSKGEQRAPVDLADVAELLGVPEDRRVAYVAMMTAMAEVSRSDWSTVFKVQVGADLSQFTTGPDATPPGASPTVGLGETTAE